MSQPRLIPTMTEFTARFESWPSCALSLSLHFLRMAEEFPSDDAWIRETRASLDPSLKEALEVLDAIGILKKLAIRLLAHNAIDQSVPQFIDWIDGLEADYLGELLANASGRKKDTRSAESGIRRTKGGVNDTLAAWKGVELPASVWERVDTLRAEPGELRAFLVEVLRRFWSEHGEADRAACAVVIERELERQRAANRPRTFDELFTDLVGRRPAVGASDFEGIEEIIAVPACHLGPYVVATQVDEPRPALILTYEPGRVASRGRYEPGAVLPASLFRALGDETRLQILRFLQSGERYGGEIVEHCGLSQPSISRHLRLLAAEGLIGVRREGGTKYYRLNPETFAIIARSIEHLGK